MSTNVIGVFNKDSKNKKKSKDNINVKDKKVDNIVDSDTSSLPLIPDVIEDFKKETDEEFNQILHKYL